MKQQAEVNFGSVEDEIPFRNFLTFRLSRVHAKLNAQASATLKRNCDLNLTQWRIMLLLGTVSHTTSSMLTAATGIDKGLFSRNLKFLVEDKLVSIKINKEDHRQQFISLTARGMRLYDKIAPIMRARQQYLASVLTGDERQALSSALRKLEAAAEIIEFEPIKLAG